MKICYRCNIEKPFSSFGVHSKKHDKLQTACKECKKEIDKEHYKNNKEQRKKLNLEQKTKIREYITQQKQKPCHDCGKTYPHYVMDFDHLSNKEFQISFAIVAKYSLKRIEKEIQKCELVCSNCHRIRTHNRRLAQ
jgi:hypothetical protein